MTPKSINEKALYFLSLQSWRKAQDLFFYNVKKYPCHKTYNNLGYFLITEGLECKNGKIISGINRGTKYLLKAYEFETSEINVYALLTSIDYQLRQAKKTDFLNICNEACCLLEKALSIKYSHELMYNLLRFKYMLGQNVNDIILDLEKLLEQFVCKESVSLYFELVRNSADIEKGEKIISDYNSYLDELDIFMFYSKMELYKNAFLLSANIVKKYSVDEFIASAIIESSIKTSNYSTAEQYYREFEEEFQFSKKSKLLTRIFSSSLYRKEKINEYKYFPPCISKCGYFGCSEHQNSW